MRLRIDDLKKTLTRRHGTVTLSPHLIPPDVPPAALAELIALYDAWAGRARAGFPESQAAQLVGDYRLARCLSISLGEWYVWASPPWPGPASTAEAEALATWNISSPIDLRLCLYDAVNTSGAGYLPGDQREAALDGLAHRLGLRRAILDALLRLDADDDAVLTPTEHAPPSPRALAIRYNQLAVEALLSNAAHVEWVLSPSATPGAGSGIGTVVKNVCFLARRMGVQYDVAFADAPPEPVEVEQRRVAERGVVYDADPASEGGEPLPSERAVAITLYGPQEVMGAANQYGERLARLCRVLLGYRRRGRRGDAALGGTGLRGAASVYLHGRPVRFELDARLLGLLGEEAEAAAPLSADGVTIRDEAFDSSLERTLADEFASLERAGASHGWRLEREPEPLLAAGTILIPDFALTRERQRIYLEIAGYWRPEYRERKMRKLSALAGKVALFVAAPQSAREEFAALGGRVPLLWYAHTVSAQAVLTALEHVYDDWPRRLARLDVAVALAKVARRGRIAVPESFALLGCYTRAEFAEAVRRLTVAGGDAAATVEWVEGVGLCSGAWIAEATRAAHALVAGSPESRLALDAFAEGLRSALPALPDASPTLAEALALRVGLVVERGSMFDALVAMPGAPPAASAETESATPARKVQPRRSSRRKHSDTSGATQPSLLPGFPGETSSEPDPLTRATE